MSSRVPYCLSHVSLLLLLDGKVAAAASGARGGAGGVRGVARRGARCAAVPLFFALLEPGPNRCHHTYIPYRELTHKWQEELDAPRGPMTAREARKLLAQGQLGLGSLGWCSGMDGWQVQPN